jgi:hypothetical protein
VQGELGVVAGVFVPRRLKNEGDDDPPIGEPYPLNNFDQVFFPLNLVSFVLEHLLSPSVPSFKGESRTDPPGLSLLLHSSIEF